jgi:type VI secretion system secreted protein VgrG
VLSGVCLQAAQLPVNLNTAGSFTILGASTVTNTGFTIVNGNVGISPGSAVTGFPPGTVVGGALHVADGPAGTAQSDLTAAYIDAAGRTLPAVVAGDLGGLTLPPGLYKSTSSLGITGVLTLDGQGNSNSVFIFQVGSGLTTATSSQVVLIGGAQAANIFWQVGSSATLGTYSIFNGTIMAQASVSIATGAALNGRALARTGAVTLDSNTGINPGPPVTSGSPPALAVSCPQSTALVGVAYNSLVAASGGTPPYTLSINPGSLPPGLILNAATGAVTGTPTGAGGTSAFTANALDSLSASATNACSIVVTGTAGQADVSITKTGPATGVAAGTNITYNIAVANAGPASAASVTVYDVIPAGTTFVSATPSQGSCSGTSTVSCSLGTILSGGSATIAIVVTSPGGLLSNTATVVSTTPDPVTGNNGATSAMGLVTQGVPSLSTWGLAGLALLLAGFGVRFIRRAHA